MSRKNIRRRDEPLNLDDLRKCYRVLGGIYSDFGINPGSDEADRIAAITIELYQQGVRDPRQLRHIVDAARGLDLRAEVPDTIVHPIKTDIAAVDAAGNLSCN
ncbi:hypothetical protein [Rhizobium cauense]|uniref:hypothetical protein n=1 Tax=Rhizobium cauense TaxID=1166683 RepID=UPI001CB79FEA|nr:hypothetical protein [Rhizobium cauense]